MRRSVAITPEEPRRVYWTKVSIDNDGQLTASNAHEINQPMAEIITISGTCLGRLDLPIAMVARGPQHAIRALTAYRNKFSGKLARWKRLPRQ
jgi:hypothetical protein